MLDEPCPYVERVDEFASRLRRSLCYPDTFRSIPGGSESVIVDENLQSLLNLMRSYSKTGLISSKTNVVKEKLYLAGSASLNMLYMPPVLSSLKPK